MGIGIVKTDIFQLLLDIYEFLDNYADVNDGSNGQPIANRAMSLQMDVKEAMDELEDL